MEPEVGGIVLCQDGCDVVVLDVVSHLPDDERLPRNQSVDGLELFALHLYLMIHLRIHIPHVLHGPEQVVAREIGLHGVVEHRLLTDVPQRAVDPSGGVAPRHGIDAEGYLEDGEPSGIAFLPHVLLKLHGVEVLVCRLYSYALEQILPLGNVLGRGARASQDDNADCHQHHPHRTAAAQGFQGQRGHIPVQKYDFILNLPNMTAIFLKSNPPRTPSLTLGMGVLGGFQSS